MGFGHRISSHHLSSPSSLSSSSYHRRTYRSRRVALVSAPFGRALGLCRGVLGGGEGLPGRLPACWLRPAVLCCACLPACLLACWCVCACLVLPSCGRAGVPAVGCGCGGFFFFGLAEGGSTATISTACVLASCAFTSAAPSMLPATCPFPSSSTFMSYLTAILFTKFCRKDTRTRAGRRRSEDR